MMNLIEAFANYLEVLGIATIGQDLFIGKAPNSLKVADSVWWVRENGGSPIQKNSTGEFTKEYTFDIFYRNTNYKSVSDAIFNLNTTLDADSCAQLQGFDIIDIRTTTYPVDDDLDTERRKVGLLQVSLTIYKGE